MIPTAIRLAAVSAKPATKRASYSFSRAAINVASLSAIATLYIGWPVLINSLERKNHGYGTVEIPEQKIY